MKHQIRQHIKETIKSIPPQKKQEYSFSITQKIIKKFGHLNNWHIYTTMSDEVDTTMLIAHLKQTGGKKIFNCETSTENLPKLDIIIVPGRAFTHDGKRLGRGKGHYDQFLAKFPNSKKIGICFPEQILENIPMESHDIFMNEIITSEESQPLKS